MARANGDSWAKVAAALGPIEEDRQRWVTELEVGEGPPSSVETALREVDGIAGRAFAPPGSPDGAVGVEVLAVWLAERTLEVGAKTAVSEAASWIGRPEFEAVEVVCVAVQAEGRLELGGGVSLSALDELPAAVTDTLRSRSARGSCLVRPRSLPWTRASEPSELPDESPEMTAAWLALVLATESDASPTGRGVYAADGVPVRGLAWESRPEPAPGDGTRVTKEVGGRARDLQKALLGMSDTDLGLMRVSIEGLAKAASRGRQG